MSYRDPEVGEHVIVHGGQEEASYTTVDRLTKTMIVTASGMRFQRDGFRRQVAREWGARYLTVQGDDAWESQVRAVEVLRRKRNARFWAKAVLESPTNPDVLRQAAERFAALADWHETETTTQEENR